MFLDPTLFHLYGPFAIRIYGLMIALGLCIFMILSFYDAKRRRYIADDIFHGALVCGILAGVVGGRFLYFITEAIGSQASVIDFFLFWEPGFSLLGAVIAIPVIVGLYLKKEEIPFLLFFDLIIMYIPLLQSIARLGCFGAGCCHGMESETASWWTVSYTHPESLAPQNVALYPTQLYSALASFILFVILYVVSRRSSVGTGFLFSLYLIGEGFARFFVDFWRSRTSYELEHALNIFQYQITYYQGISIAIMLFGVVLLVRSFYMPEVVEKKNYDYI